MEEPCDLEMTLDGLAEILSATIKKDEVNKRILFLGMLLNYTEEDQQNFAFNAPSSTGKSYLALEIASYFPEEDVMCLAYTSPKAFFHELGELTTEEGAPLDPRPVYIQDRLEEWARENPRPVAGKGLVEWKDQLRAVGRRFKLEWDQLPKVYRVDLERKIIIFIDQPHDELLRVLRSLLSHDQKVIRTKITDKTKEGGHKTKTIDLVGFPTMVFNSARFMLEDQERTRLFILSPEMSQDKLKASLELLAERLSNRLEFAHNRSKDEKRLLLKARVEAIKTAGVREIIIRPDDQKYIIDKFLEEHPYLAPRLQRDLPRLIAIIKSHALFNYFTRDRRDDKVWATRLDVEEGYKLYKEVGESNELGIPPQVYNLWNEKLKPVLETGTGLSRKELARIYFEYYKTRIGKKQQKRMVDLLCEVGLVVEQPDPKDRRFMNIYTPQQGGEENTDEEETRPESPNLSSFIRDVCVDCSLPITDGSNILWDGEDRVCFRCAQFRKQTRVGG